MKTVAILMLLTFPVGAAELKWCLDNFPPYHEFKNGDRQPEGPSVALMRHLAKTADIKLTILPKTPPKRCFQLLAAGEADVMTNLLYKPERAEFMTLLPMGAKRRDSLIVRYGEKRDFSDITRLKHARIIMIHGYHYEQSFVDFLNTFPHEQLNEVSDIQSGLNIISKGRADVLIAPSMPALTVAVANFPPNSFDRIKSPWVPPKESLVYMGLSKKSVSSDVVDHLKRALEQAIADGTVDTIFASRTVKEEVALLKSHGSGSGKQH